MRVLLLFFVDFSHLESYIIVRLWFFLFKKIFTLFFPLESFHLSIHLKPLRGFLYLFDELIWSGKIEFEEIFCLGFWWYDLLLEVSDLAEYFIGVHGNI